MYENFFGLRDRPFAGAAAAKRRFATTALEAALQSVAEAIEHGGNVAVVIGPVGCGKTVFCQSLAERMRSRSCVAMLSNGRLAKRRAVYQAILFALRMPYRGRDETELRLSLLEKLDSQEFAGGLLLLVDDAHMLSVAALDELRCLTDQAADGRPAVRIVLCGGPALEEHLADPRLEPLAQRISVRAHLAPLTQAETAEYVRFHVASAGGNVEALYSPEALEAMYRTTEGVPRLINQLGEHALILARVAGHRRLEAAIVDEAWSDLQQLPLPSTSRDRAADAPAVVEFGDWDESTGDEARELQAIPFPSRTDEGDFAPTAPPPHIELDLAATGDPFGEKFADEEVVTDAFSKLAADAPRFPVPYVPSGTPTFTAPPDEALDDENYDGHTVVAAVALPWAAGRLPNDKHVAAAAELASASADAAVDSPVSVTLTMDDMAFLRTPSRAKTEVLPLAEDADTGAPTEGVLALPARPSAPSPPPSAAPSKSYGRLFSNLRRGAQERRTASQ